jgi:hypothetical protein
MSSSPRASISNGERTIEARTVATAGTRLASTTGAMAATAVREDVSSRGSTGAASSSVQPITVAMPVG